MGNIRNRRRQGLSPTSALASSSRQRDAIGLGFPAPGLDTQQDTCDNSDGLGSGEAAAALDEQNEAAAAVVREGAWGGGRRRQRRRRPPEAEAVRLAHRRDEVRPHGDAPQAAPVPRPVVPVRGLPRVPRASAGDVQDSAELQSVRRRRQWRRRKRKGRLRRRDAAAHAQAEAAHDAPAQRRREPAPHRRLVPRVPGPRGTDPPGDEHEPERRVHPDGHEALPAHGHERARRGRGGRAQGEAERGAETAEEGEQGGEEEAEGDGGGGEEGREEGGGGKGSEEEATATADGGGERKRHRVSS
ncbi:hypothetical protein THAOC_01025 [Thalassiosira oceanica]|uniref:Uncharacterized protein n=1 Tax=Thalassiosira oceanica TaxID=159749 RepID=K0TI23_THAOC|nr:hypothetical protein THAOC_01025 [Thalassiosira oceanica]|eukprot:EJK77160.1 hypothetical protein THAOC_01025 [Thalassiosira oceanica]